ncbi:MAG: aspartate--tRNA(Asn) ligase [Alphaproteobacteria bacterium]|nr:aspartate--tRNA(Asn) ligase [Alphaproteobacteria bacterium]
MQNRIHLSELSAHIGKKVLIAGHAQTLRKQSSVAFIIVRDITGTVQCVIGKDNAAFETVKELATESVIKITGAVVETKSTKEGLEIQIESLDVMSAADPLLPIPIIEKGDDEVSAEKRMDWRFLTLRRERDATIMKALSAIDRGYSEFLISKGFIGIHTPKFMASPSESNAELFSLDYFGQTAYLAQSPQFFKQMGIASGLEQVFEIGSVFRADNSFTTRHATEFIGHDAEMGYIDSFSDVMDMLEGSLAAVLAEVDKSCGAEIEKHLGIKDIGLKKPMVRLTMHKAREILKSRGHDVADGDMTTAEEKAIGEYVSAELGSDFVFITEFPWSARPFYHKKGVSSDDGVSPISISADLLYKGVEIATTAQREENYEKLVAQIAEKKLKLEGLQWFANFFRFGMPPHGGWGMGGQRIAKQLLNLDSIRDAQFLFRGPNRLAP